MDSAPYSPRLDASPLDRTFVVDGMTCGGCVAAVEAVLASQPGVCSARVNLATRRAAVRFDPAVTSLESLLSAVAAAGYSPRPAVPALAETAGQPTTDPRAMAPGKRESRQALFRMLLAWLGMMQVMMFAYPAYVADAGTLTLDAEQLMRIAGLIITTPVLAISGAPFIAQAWRDLRRRAPGMDVPVALGLLAAYAASALATWRGAGEVYYDSIAMFLAFLLTARWFESKGRAKATAEIERLASLTPATASLLPNYPARDPVVEVQVGEIRPGQHVLIAAGGYVGVDGTIVSGETRADEAWLTGESRPVRRSLGGKLLAGSLNLDNPVVVQVTTIGAATELGLMLRLMEQAASEKPAIVRLADRIAARFVMAVLLLAALAALGWWFVEPERALPVALAVLVVSCPCALSLATPVAVAAAQGALARMGVLMARGHALEALATATTFVFDKTGTLTAGRPVLAQTITRDAEAVHTSLAIAAALEQGSTHPLARAFADAARQAGLCTGTATEVVATPGAGVEGVIDGVRYRVGSADFVAALAGTATVRPALAEDAFGSRVYLGSAGEWHAAYCVADAPRPGALAAVRALQAAHCEVVILSGDQAEVVAAVARSLGITRYHAGLKPQEKHALLTRMQKQGAVVAMVGDGINDGPVLAQAQVSIVMGQGAPLAQQKGDLVLLAERLDVIVEARTLALTARRVMRQNLTWAFGYNLVTIPLAVMGWMPPAVAALGMSLSSLAVVMNAVRLIAPRRATLEPTPQPLPAMQ